MSQQGHTCARLLVGDMRMVGEWGPERSTPWLGRVQARLEVGARQPAVLRTFVWSQEQQEAVE